MIRGLKSLQAELLKQYGDKGLKEIVGLMALFDLAKKDDDNADEVSVPDVVLN